MTEPTTIENQESVPQSCENCWHNRKGYCAMYSSTCATAAFNKGKLPWWTSYEDGYEQAQRILGFKEEMPW